MEFHVFYLLFGYIDLPFFFMAEKIVIEVCELYFKWVLLNEFNVHTIYDFIVIMSRLVY